MGKIEDVGTVDGEEDVANGEAGALGRGARLNGRHHDWPGAVDPKSELSFHSLNRHRLVAFCTEEWDNSSILFYPIHLLAINND